MIARFVLILALVALAGAAPAGKMRSLKSNGPARTSARAVFPGQQSKPKDHGKVAEESLSTDDSSVSARQSKDDSSVVDTFDAVRRLVFDLRGLLHREENHLNRLSRGNSMQQLMLERASKAHKTNDGESSSEIISVYDSGKVSFESEDDTYTMDDSSVSASNVRKQNNPLLRHLPHQSDGKDKQLPTPKRASKVYKTAGVVGGNSDSTSVDESESVSFDSEDESDEITSVGESESVSFDSEDESDE